MGKVTVKVPATSANLGPGFDSVGCAFELYNIISFTQTEEGLTFSGCDEEFANNDNLTVVAFDNTLKRLGKERKGLKIDFLETGVPVSRGLGSSAALIVAGATAANALYGNTLSKEEILHICNDIEGHPDNLSPAIYGGLTASFVNDNIPYSIRYNPHPSLMFVALIPDFKLQTSLARSVLPKEIPFADAVFNASHVAVLLKAIENGEKKMISLALNDKLHQPYRKHLIDGYETAESIAKHLGCISFCISGAGPTCLCLTDSEIFADKLETKLKENGIYWQVKPLHIDNFGATVI